MNVDVPASASDEEAAAIVAAIGAHLDAERAAAATADGESASWAGEKWRFAGRLDAVGAAAGRVPDGAPSDDWAAAGRADRF